MSHINSFLEKNLNRFTLLLQESIQAEETAATDGLLQRMDARVKTAGLLLILLSAAFSHSITVLVALLILDLLFAWRSRVFSFSFLRRTWLFMPLYTAIIAFPALFTVPGPPLYRIPFAGLTITVSGLHTAVLIVLRVSISVSCMLLLVLTTTWPRLLKSLRKLHVPRIIVFLLAITYRYIYVFLQTMNSFFLARKSRTLTREHWQTSGRWLGTVVGTLLGKSLRMSDDVYRAMIARGFQGEPALLDEFAMGPADFLWLCFFLLIPAITFLTRQQQLP